MESIANINIGGQYLERKPEQGFYLEKMTNSEIEIVKATTDGLRIGNMTENEKKVLAAKVYSTANVRLGYKAKSTEESKAEISVLYLDLSKFYGLTGTEVLLALNSGLDGEFLKENETVFFNSTNFVQWCRKYIESKKMPAMKKHENNRVVAERETPKPLPSIKEQRAILNAVIEQHKAILEKDIDQAFMFDCGVHYDNLGRLDMFQFSDNELIEIVAMVCEKYPKLNDEQLLKKAKHQAWVKYILSLITPEIEEAPTPIVKQKKNARPTMALNY